MGVGGTVAEFDGDFVRLEAAGEDAAGDGEGVAGVELGDLAVAMRGVDADLAPEGV